MEQHDDHARVRHGKDELRRLVLRARGALTPERRALLSSAVCRRAAELPELAGAHTVMAFASFGTELDTRELLEWGVRRGGLCLPRILGPRRMAAFAVTDLATDLRPGRYDIPEPVPSLPEVPADQIDAVVVPGVLFDCEGGRCGYGGGFYDTFLPTTRPDTPRIGLAFELQLVGDVPCHPHDLPVHVLVTEERVIRQA